MVETGPAESSEKTASVLSSVRNTEKGRAGSCVLSRQGRKKKKSKLEVWVELIVRLEIQ